MVMINSKMSLPEKLRAHADNMRETDVDVTAQWCMRDAANVIEALNREIVQLENENDDTHNQKSQVGEG